MSEILFVHNNFPAQFVGLADALVRDGHRCAAIGSRTAQPRTDVALVRWGLGRGTTAGLWPDAVRAEADFLRGRAAARAAETLAGSGFVPDLIIGHPGWGETLFLREVFPHARQILLGEFFYRTSGADVGFDSENGTLSSSDRFGVHAKNATMMLALSDADHVVCPTAFQASTLPEILQPRISVIHEGVDTGRLRPLPDPRLALPGGRVLDRSDEVVTFVNRTFEPLRGFRTFMRALPAFQAARPDAQIVLIGSEKGRGYGSQPPKGSTWKEVMLSELGHALDLTRVHFIGPVPSATLQNALSIGRAHVYYTYPFVLSWSLLEAMACESLIIASDTAPVREVIRHQHDGLLHDFFDAALLADAMIEACRHPEGFASLRRNARRVVELRFDRERTCLPAWLDLVRRCLGQAQRPPIQ